jgi:hypothetical protein
MPLLLQAIRVRARPLHLNAQRFEELQYQPLPAYHRFRFSRRWLMTKQSGLSRDVVGILVCDGRGGVRSARRASLNSCYVLFVEITDVY